MLFFSKRTVPVRLSIRIADLAFKTGAAGRDRVVTIIITTIKKCNLSELMFLIFKLQSRLSSIRRYTILKINIIK